VNIRKGLPVKLTDNFGSFARIALESKQTKSLLRNEILSKSKDIVKNLNDLIDNEVIDEACDEISIDFIQNRLPLPTTIPIKISTKKSKKISSTSMVRLVEPANSIHFAMEEIDGVSLLCIANTMNNNRLSHMGHPLDYDDDNDDDDESSIKDINDISSIYQITIPSRLAPIIVCLKQSSPNLMQISEIIKLMKILMINESEVIETINKLYKEGIIYVD
jgi:hypothetical protein